MPQLRFPEFSNEWESTKLGDISDVSKLAGFEFTKHIEYSDTGSIIALRGLNIKSNGLDLSDVKYIDNSDFSKLSRSKLYIDDMMFTYVGTIGETAIIKENDRFYLAPNVSRIRLKDDTNSVVFINQYFNNSGFRNIEIEKYIATSSQPALSMSNIRLFCLQLPTKPEQQKIAAFLTTVDNKIEQLSKKQALLGEYKKGLMQQIFSQVIRFKADDGSTFPDWEEKKLGDVVSTPVSDGPHLTPKFVKKGIPFLSVNNLVESKIDFSDARYISIDDHLVFSKKCKPKKGDVLLGKAASVGKVAFVETDVEFNIWSPIAMIRPSNSNFSKYIYYCFQTRFILNQISKFTNSSSQGNIGMGDISKIIIKLPSKLEQAKIAGFLSSIDNKIEQVGEQLRESKQFKKALLQQMFV